MAETPDPNADAEDTNSVGASGYSTNPPKPPLFDIDEDIKIDDYFFWFKRFHKSNLQYLLRDLDRKIRVHKIRSYISAGIAYLLLIIVLILVVCADRIVGYVSKPESKTPNIHKTISYIKNGKKYDTIVFTVDSLVKIDSLIRTK